MKKCTIIVKKVYEMKKDITTTKRTVVLSEEALSELCTLVLEHVKRFKNTSLNLLCEAFTGL